jgi:hypothetical protein
LKQGGLADSIGTHHADEMLGVDDEVDVREDLSQTALFANAVSDDGGRSERGRKGHGDL